MAAQGRAINVMGKPVYLHFNGDIFKRKRIVVNQRKMRSFDSFLDAATTSLGKPAREIRTPHGRTRIRNLEDLQRDCTYVVMGREKKPFKEVDYTSSRFAVKDFRTQRLAPLKEPEGYFLQLNHRKFRNVPGKARINGLRVKEEIKTIIVFCNGIVSKPRRVQLRTDFKMYQVLESVNDKVSSYSKNGAVYELYTLDGHKIYEPHELDDNGQYVAVGRERHFDRSVSYNDQGIASQLTPRRASTKPKVMERKPPAKHRGVAKRTSKKSSLVADSDEPITSLAADITRRDFSDIKSSPEPVKEEEPQSLFDSFKETVTESLRDDDEPKAAYAAERRNSSQQSDIEDIPLKDTIQEKVADVLGDHGVPVGGLFDDKDDKSQEDRRNSSDNVHPSVYEASGENREDATEIQEDKETEEDKPIDQMPAEEVADEEIEAEDNENGEEADEEGNNEARDSENGENAGEEGNNNEAEEVPEDEIEDNDEANEEDDEKDHPEVNEASEDNETNEPLDANKANEPNDTSDPTEESEPQESLK